MATGTRLGIQTLLLHSEGRQLLLGDMPVPGSLDCRYEAVPDWLVSALVLQEHGSRRLLLDQSLPSSWHCFPWERLPGDGFFLGERVQIIRSYRRAPLEIREGRSILLDRWPDERFIKALQPEVEAGRIDVRRGESVDHWLLANPDLSDHRELILIAHGSRDRHGLLTESGLPWPLRLAPKLPPLIWILSCEERDGAFDHLVSNAFTHGAQCVVCPDGLLSAGRVALLLAEWIGISSSPSIADWILEKQRFDSTTGGSDALLIHGAV